MKAGKGPLSVRPVDGWRERVLWRALPGRIMADDASWIQPLALQERRRIDPGSNPFFGFGEAQLLLAWRGDRPVGRISAHVNGRHLERHRDATGHFGFFDCADDAEAAAALVEAARQWLRARGLQRMVGPMSFTINEEVGLLVDGFGEPPALLMGHAPRWAGGLLEGAGLSKVVDTYAYRLRTDNVPPLLGRLAGLAARSGRITARPFDMTRYKSEVEALVGIFNDAWSDNWGFVPFARAEIDALVSETRHLLKGRYGRFLLIDGEPMGVMLALPDLNDVIRGYGGRLLPFNWVHLLGAFRAEHWRSARIPLLGLRRSLRSDPLAPAMLALLVAELLAEARNYPLEWIELSWVLESNRSMVTLAEIAAGKPVKTYRVYGCDL